jgi:hypothetical protein
MTSTIHHISKRLSIEEYWTVEKTPQLDRVKISSLDGDVNTASIEARDLDDAVSQLMMILYDRTAQMRLKRRLKLSEKEAES